MPRILVRAGHHTKQFGVVAGILVAMSVAPLVALAAYNDVNLTTDTILSVNGITLSVSGTTAVIESITVNETDFTVTLPSGSNFEVSAPSLARLTPSTRTSLIKDVCSNAQSTLGFAPLNADVTVTITPSTSLVCSSNGSHTSSSGGGGGGTSHTTTPATPAVPATKLTGCRPESGDLFDVTTGKSCTVRATPAVPASPSLTAARSFKLNLTTGSRSDDVKSLQQFLNTHGYVITSSGPGSSGNETSTFGGLTRAALIRYQKAKGITPAIGYFGIKTRAAINAEQ